MIPLDVLASLRQGFVSCLSGTPLNSCMIPLHAKNGTVLYLVLSACQLQNDGISKVRYISFISYYYIDFARHLISGRSRY